MSPMPGRIVKKNINVPTVFFASNVAMKDAVCVRLWLKIKMANHAVGILKKVNRF